MSPAISIAGLMGFWLVLRVRDNTYRYEQERVIRWAAAEAARAGFAYKRNVCKDLGLSGRDQLGEPMILGWRNCFDRVMPATLDLAGLTHQTARPFRSGDSWRRSSRFAVRQSMK